MINFCVKSIHSLLRFGFSSPSKNNQTLDITPHHGRNIPPPAAGLGLLTFSGDTHRPVKVVESAAMKSPPPPPPSPPATATATWKKDPGGIGFLDEVGGSIDGLMSCTESLGFESSDERRVDDHQMDGVSTNDDVIGLRVAAAAARKKWKSTAVKSEKKKFPPPLSSLNHDGKPAFLLRPVRRDGRLELTEVKIDRSEVLRASRQDGRLRLNLIRDVDVEEQSEEEVEDEEVEVTIEEEEDEEEEEEEEEGETISEKLVFPVMSGGGNGVRRCHEIVSHCHTSAEPTVAILLCR